MWVILRGGIIRPHTDTSLRIIIFLLLVIAKDVIFLAIFLCCVVVSESFQVKNHISSEVISRFQDNSVDFPMIIDNSSGLSLFRNEKGTLEIKGWYISLTPSPWTATNGLPKWTT